MFARVIFVRFSKINFIILKYFFIFSFVNANVIKHFILPSGFYTKCH